MPIRDCRNAASLSSPAELVRLSIATVSRYKPPMGSSRAEHAASTGQRCRTRRPATTPLVAVCSSSISSPASATTGPGVLVALQQVAALNLDRFVPGEPSPAVDPQLRPVDETFALEPLGPALLQLQEA